MKITEDFIIAFTGNASAVSNGRKLASGGKFQSLYISQDETLIFGSCAGSGKTPYNCSVDFVDPQQPVPRCSCPSRQIPCKHVVGLLYCRLQGKAFAPQEIPEDVAAKRGKIQARAEKKAEKAAVEKEKGPTPMTKQKANAAIKKCSAQLEGIALGEKVLGNILLAGLHAIDKKNMKLYESQVKELGNYYIGGIQAALTDLLLEAQAAQQAQDFSGAVEQVNYLYALLKKARSHTENKIADYSAFPEMTDTALDATLHSPIEEQMGYAWKLTELAEKGLVRENEELLQVGFNCLEDNAKKEFVDEGVWISLTGGEIFLTKTLRPFNRVKYIKADDTFFPVLRTPEMSIYPGEKNPRVRWDSWEPRPVTPEDYQKAQSFAQGDYAAVIKEVKNQIKSPLADKRPVYALKVTRLEQAADGNYAIFDTAGTRITLVPEQFAFLLRKLSREQAEGQTMVCRFGQDLTTDLLYANPIAIVTGDSVIRFTY